MSNLFSTDPSEEVSTVTLRRSVEPVIRNWVGGGDPEDPGVLQATHIGGVKIGGNYIKGLRIRGCGLYKPRSASGAISKKVWCFRGAIG